jgi:hypothetical protein
MTGMAQFVMRGPWQAATAACVGVLLGLVLPPLAWVSGGVVALVTLRLGDRALPRALLPAAAGLALVGGIVWARPGALLVAGVATWLPAYLGARVLRQRGRLDDPLLVACGLGWASVAVLHWVVPDVTAAWRDMLQQIVPAEETADGTALTAAQIRSNLDAVAPLMTAALGASVTLGAIASVVLGRWWQAVLDAPGSFQRAFHDLRMGQVAAVVTAALVAAAFATSAALVRGLAAAAAVVFVVQGLAVVHGVVARRGLGNGWLGGIYVLTVMLPLQMIFALVLIGVVDAWADFRRQAERGTD